MHFFGAHLLFTEISWQFIEILSSLSNLFRSRSVFQKRPIQQVERVSTCLSKWHINSKPDGGGICILKEVRICNI